MSKMSRSKLGRSAAGETNRQKQRKYNAERDAGKRKAAGGQARSSVMKGPHVESCGNPACRKCFVRVADMAHWRVKSLRRAAVLSIVDEPGTRLGVYPAHGKPIYPGRVIDGQRYPSMEHAIAGGQTEARWFNAAHTAEA